MVLPFIRHRSTSFTPADLFRTYSDGFWFDAGRGTFTDEARTTPTTTDAAVILGWADQSGNERHCNAATGAVRKNSIVNGLPVLRFDGDGDYLALATLAGFGAAAEIFIVMKTRLDPNPDDPETGFCMFGTGAETDHHPYTNGEAYNGAFSSARKGLGNPTPSFDAFHLLNIWSASADWNFLVNGTSVFSTGTNTVAFTTTPYIGRSFADYWFDGDMAEIICVNAKVTAGERAKTKSYFGTKYGLTIA